MTYSAIPEKMQQAHPGIIFNDSPRMPDGTRAMFVRILSKSDTRKSFEQIKDLNPQAPAHVDDAGLLRVWAPDGDLVFSAMPTDHRNAHFICRMHREVYRQG